MTPACGVFDPTALQRGDDRSKIFGNRVCRFRNRKTDPARDRKGVPQSRVMTWRWRSTAVHPHWTCLPLACNMQSGAVIHSFVDETTRGWFRERNTRAARRVPHGRRATQRKLKVPDAAAGSDNLRVPAGNGLTATQGRSGRPLQHATSERAAPHQPSVGAGQCLRGPCRRLSLEESELARPRDCARDAARGAWRQGIGQSDAARRLHISLNRLNEIVWASADQLDTALRLARCSDVAAIWVGLRRLSIFSKTMRPEATPS